MTLRELVHKRIADQRAPLEQALLDGVPDSLHAYHRLVGKIEGLQLAYREIEGLLAEEFVED